MSIIEDALNRGRHAARKQQGEQPREAAARPRPVPTDEADAAPHRAERIALDLEQLRDIGIWPPPSMEKELRAQYRRIKRPIMQNAMGGAAEHIPAGNLVVVTSSVEGEGKTFTSLNLALSLSQEVDCEVMLVDGDIIRRTTSTMLGLDERQGLADLLADNRLSLDELMLTTNISSLKVLPAGQAHSLSSELMSSARMDALMHRLSTDNPRRIVIFDSPPLLPTPETLALAKLAGQIAVVVKAGSTQRHQVLEAIGLLDPQKPVNLILNQSKRAHGGEYYGGYYG